MILLSNTKYYLKNILIQAGYNVTDVVNTTNIVHVKNTIDITQINKHINGEPVGEKAKDIFNRRIACLFSNKYEEKPKDGSEFTKDDAYTVFDKISESDKNLISDSAKFGKWYVTHSYQTIDINTSLFKEL